VWRFQGGSAGCPALYSARGATLELISKVGVDKIRAPEQEAGRRLIDRARGRPHGHTPPSEPETRGGPVSVTSRARDAACKALIPAPLPRDYRPQAGSGSRRTSNTHGRECDYDSWRDQEDPPREVTAPGEVQVVGTVLLILALLATAPLYVTRILAQYRRRVQTTPHGGRRAASIRIVELVDSRHATHRTWGEPRPGAFRHARERGGP